MCVCKVVLTPYIYLFSTPSGRDVYIYIYILFYSRLNANVSNVSVKDLSAIGIMLMRFSSISDYSGVFLRNRH